jgi:glutathione synthase/RimK-type ligase-like ATP-grasp enzyme
MLTLLWGQPGERPIAAVAEALYAMLAPLLVLDQGESAQAELEVGAEVAGWVRTGTASLDLSDVGAVYLRPYASDLREPEAAALQDLMLAWCDVTPALVLNRPRRMVGNSAKPHQLQQVRACGLLVPETLVTTDPEAAASFWQRHGAVIYKSVSGIRSRVARLGPAHRERLPEVASCPTQFQQFIAGRDHRVHVVGDDVFACELICEADDYRYPREHSLHIREAGLPPEVEEACLRLSRVMQLPLAGIDLRRTAEGAWYCFEVNPSPAFTFYADPTGQPIADAIATLLAAGPDRPVAFDWVASPLPELEHVRLFS